jgi:very-short-patch-repair endonuclease
MTMKPWDNRKYLQEEYETKERSTNDIAREHGVFPNQIRRALIKHGFKVRDRSAAQKNNIEKNGAPMQGRTRTEAEKVRISEGMQKWWDALSDDEKNAVKSRLSDSAREKWETMTDEEKKEIVGKMHKANRKRMRAGSKNENLVADLLINAGYKIAQRTKDFTPGRRFEIDLCIPTMKIAIEWDGATHFDPIYGEAHLQRVRAKDKTKDSILLSSGWTVIRCRDHSTASSLAFCTRAADKIIEVIEKGERGVVHIIEAH